MAGCCPYLPLLGASSAARALLARTGIRLPDVRLPRWASAALLCTLLIASAAGGVQLLMHLYPPALLAKV